MPPVSITAPPPFPWGLSGHLPAGKALFCSITANAVVCHFPLHLLIIFSSEIFYKIKTKRKWKKKLFAIWGSSFFFLYILGVRHPRSTVLFFFTDLWINKLCSFLKAALLEELEKPQLTVWVLSMWSGLPHFWCSLELLGHARVFHFSVLQMVRKKEFVRGGKKVPLGSLIPVKINVYLPNHHSSHAFV